MGRDSLSRRQVGGMSRAGEQQDQSEGERFIVINKGHFHDGITSRVAPKVAGKQGANVQKYSQAGAGKLQPRGPFIRDSRVFK